MAKQLDGLLDASRRWAPGRDTLDDTFWKQEFCGLILVAKPPWGAWSLVRPRLGPIQLNRRHLIDDPTQRLWYD